MEGNLTSIENAKVKNRP